MFYVENNNCSNEVVRSRYVQILNLYLDVFLPSVLVIGYHGYIAYIIPTS